MVCSSLPKFSSIASPNTTSSEVVSAIACRLCNVMSGEGRFHMLNANEGCDPSSILCLKDACSTAEGERPLPYPTLPRKPIVSEEKIDFSMEKPVLTSDGLPYPSDADPARNDSVPFSSPWPFPDSTATAVELGSTIRRMGRLDTERSTHFQSSSSAPPCAGEIWMASNSVFKVTFTMVLTPPCSPTCSRRAGRKAGAETLIL